MPSLNSEPSVRLYLRARSCQRRPDDAEEPRIGQGLHGTSAVPSLVKLEGHIPSLTTHRLIARPNRMPRRTGTKGRVEEPRLVQAAVAPDRVPGSAAHCPRACDPAAGQENRVCAGDRPPAQPADAGWCEWAGSHTREHRVHRGGEHHHLQDALAHLRPPIAQVGRDSRAAGIHGHAGRGAECGGQVLARGRCHIPFHDPCTAHIHLSSTRCAMRRRTTLRRI